MNSKSMVSFTYENPWKVSHKLSINDNIMAASEENDRILKRAYTQIQCTKYVYQQNKY